MKAQGWLGLALYAAALNLCCSQAAVQMVLLAIAGLSVPWLLLAKPFILKHQMDAAHEATEGYDPLLGTATSKEDHDDEDIEVGVAASSSSVIKIDFARL